MTEDIFCPSLFLDVPKGLPIYPRMMLVLLIHSSLILFVLILKGQYHGRSMGDIMIFGQNSLTLNFEHSVTSFLNL